MTARTSRRLVLALLGLAAFALALSSADLGRMRTLLAGLGPSAWLVLAPQGIGIALQTTALASLLRTLGERIGAGHLAPLLLGTEASRMTLPTGAAASDALATMWLGARFGVPIEHAVSAIATRKWLLVATNALHAGLTWAVLARSPRRLAVASRDALEPSWLLGLATVVLTVTATLFALGLSRGSLAARFARLLDAAPWRRARLWAARHRTIFAHTDLGLEKPWSKALAPRLVLPGLLHEAVWLLEAFETWLIAHVLGVELGLAPALSIELCAGLVRAAAFVLPGGLGAQDASYVALFAAFGVHDASTVGAAFVVLKRVKELTWSGIGAFAFALAPRRLDVGRGERTSQVPPCDAPSSSSSAAR